MLLIPMFGVVDYVFHGRVFHPLREEELEAQRGYFDDVFKDKGWSMGRTTELGSALQGHWRSVTPQRRLASILCLWPLRKG